MSLVPPRDPVLACNREKVSRRHAEESEEEKKSKRMELKRRVPVAVKDIRKAARESAPDTRKAGQSVHQA